MESRPGGDAGVIVTPLKPSHIMAVLRTVEERLAVETWELSGMRVWPLVRMMLMSQWCTEVAPARGGTSTLRGALGRVRALAGMERRRVRARSNDPRGEDRPRPADVLFLNHTTCRTVAIGGRWYDVFCEPIAEHLDSLGLASLLIEHAPGSEYRLPRSRASVLVEPVLRALQAAAWLGTRIEPGTPEPPWFRELQHTLGPAGAQALFSFEAVAVRAAEVRAAAGYFARVLDEVQPRSAVVVCYYDPLGFAFTLACRERGVPVMDIQHGIQGRYHPAYAAWLRVPQGGFNLLPSSFWVWSQQDADTILAWSSALAPVHAPWVGGNLFLARFLGDRDTWVNGLDAQTARIQRKGALHVLLSLQPGLGMLDVFMEAIRKSPASWHWWVRLHPAMHSDRERIRTQLPRSEARVSLDEPTDLPLYALLRHADVHVTHSSSVTTEATHFGVRSVVCSEAGADYFHEEIAQGGTRLALNAAELIRAIPEIAHPPESHRLQQPSAPDRDAIAQALGLGSSG